MNSKRNNKDTKINTRKPASSYSIKYDGTYASITNVPCTYCEGTLRNECTDHAAITRICDGCGRHFELFSSSMNLAWNGYQQPVNSLIGHTVTFENGRIAMIDGIPQ